ncbi:(+)-neomenthol dehydrogenase [Acrasis kona]|uniref:(+)-neomenthol dehydrogenase n=1 Tax=Acrasis kona TaxID=1008807 RepID=A0AAW2YSJ7_9EUKA
MKTALVSGGNKGIGYFICKQLAKTGEYKVYLAARDQERGLKAVNEINNEVGNKNTEFVSLDVSKDQSVDELIKKIHAKNKSEPIDVLINNAGIASKGSGFDQEMAKNTINVNYYGVRRLTDGLLKRKLIKQDGRIVVVSSQAGVIGSKDIPKLKPLLDVDNLSFEKIDSIAEGFIDAAADPSSVKEKGWQTNTYSTSKALVNAYIRVLSKDLNNITINACCPGWCRTDMGGENAVRTSEEGAEVAVWLATAPKDQIDGTGCFYYDNHKIKF